MDDRLTQEQVERAAYTCRKNADEWRQVETPMGADYRSAEAAQWDEMAELWERALSIFTRPEPKASLALRQDSSGGVEKIMLLVDEYTDAFCEWGNAGHNIAEGFMVKAKKDAIRTAIASRAEPGAPQNSPAATREQCLGNVGDGERSAQSEPQAIPSTSDAKAGSIPAGGATPEPSVDYAREISQAEALMIIRSRLWDHLSVAERRELRDIANTWKGDDHG